MVIIFNFFQKRFVYVDFVLTLKNFLVIWFNVILAQKIELYLIKRAEMTI